MTSEMAPHEYQLRARVLQVFAALEDAGATPITNRDLQAVVYLSNVLSSVWGIAPIEGAVLKTKEGPRSTKLEGELDSCIGAGLIEVASIAPDEERPEKLSATFHLSERALAVLKVINSFPDERTVTSFMQEIAFAFVEIPAGLRDDAAVEDAAWTDPGVADNRIVDFGLSHRSENPSYNVVQAFQTYAPEGLIYTPAQKIELYLRLLKRRANG
jgi:hypothetical protein